MPIPQRALNLSLAAMRRLYSAWHRLTTLRKAIAVGIGVVAVMAALTNVLVFPILVFLCTMLLLLIWGVSRLFGRLGGRKWSENVRVALALAVVVGFFLLLCGFMAISERRLHHYSGVPTKQAGSLAGRTAEAAIATFGLKRHFIANYL